MSFVKDVFGTSEIDLTDCEMTARFMRTPAQLNKLRNVASCVRRTYAGLTPEQRQQRVNDILFASFIERMSYELNNTSDRDTYLADLALWDEELPIPGCEEVAAVTKSYFSTTPLVGESVGFPKDVTDAGFRALSALGVRNSQ